MRREKKIRAYVIKRGNNIEVFKAVDEDIVYTYDFSMCRMKTYNSIEEAIISTLNKNNTVVLYMGKRVKYKCLGDFVLYIDNKTDDVIKITL